jgi:hypothetical protein
VKLPDDCAAQLDAWGAPATVRAALAAAMAAGAGVTFTPDDLPGIPPAIYVDAPLDDDTRVVLTLGGFRRIERDGEPEVWAVGPPAWTSCAPRVRVTEVAIALPEGADAF